MQMAKLDRKSFGWGILVGAGATCIGIAAIAFAVVIVHAVLVRYSNRNEQMVSISDFKTWLKEGKVRCVTVESGEIHGELVSKMPGDDGNGSEFFRTEINAGATNSWAFNQWILDNKGDATVRVDN